MANDTFLITGANGCIGAWATALLVRSGAKVVATDLSEDLSRPKLLMDDDEIASVTRERLDVTDTSAVNDMVARHAVSHIIHLAGLQVPFCRANPPLGAAVNVTGTVNIFEAARHNGVKLSYASSLAALGPTHLYTDFPLGDDAATAPTTLYGVYKVANEETARIYWQDWQVGSVGLRPYVVFGVGRDQGVTADIAKAVLATAAGQPFHIRFDGPIALQHAEDAAQRFIDAARAGHEGAAVCNLRDTVIEVAEFVALLKEIRPDSQITVQEGAPLPFPADLDDSGLKRIVGDYTHRTLKDAIAADLTAFASLLSVGRVDLAQLTS